MHVSVTQHIKLVFTIIKNVQPNSMVIGSMVIGECLRSQGYLFFYVPGNLFT